MQITEDDLFETAMGIISLSGRSEVRIFVREDKFKRFASVICYIPKKDFSAGVREKTQQLLAHEFNGEVTGHHTQVSDIPLARVHFVIKAKGGLKNVKYKEIEQKISDIATAWQDKFIKNLKEIYDDSKANKIFENYSQAFPLSYTAHFSSKRACTDIMVIKELMAVDHPVVKLYKEEQKNIYSLKIYSKKEQLLLSQMMPILENFGLEIVEEHTYLITPKLSNKKEEVWLHNFKVVVDDVSDGEFAETQRIFEEAILKSWLNEIENDSLNKLVLTAHISARDVSLIRSYARYLKQTNFSYSFEFVANALYKNSNLAKEFVKLFYARFKSGNQDKATQIEENIDKLLVKVTNLSEDSVIRKILELIKATLRTNYFQIDV